MLSMYANKLSAWTCWPLECHSNAVIKLLQDPNTLPHTEVILGLLVQYLTLPLPSSYPGRFHPGPPSLLPAQPLLPASLQAGRLAGRPAGQGAARAGRAPGADPAAAPPPLLLNHLSPVILLTNVILLKMGRGDFQAGVKTFLVAGTRIFF